MPLTAHVNIGSNIGDRLSNISTAVAAIERRLGPGAALRRSCPFVSEPWGYESANSFINVAVAFDTSLPPLDLLDLLLDAQAEVDPSPHRDSRGNYIDRRIDIDLIALGNLVVDTPRLTLPHPRMHLRDFVTVPLRELDPLWVHPLLGPLWH